jgi:hypothetical protein
MITIDKIADAIQKTINKIPSPAAVLPEKLLYCTALRRPGVSPYRITSNIIATLPNIGIDVSPNEDGTPNVVNEYTYAVVKGIVDGIKEMGVVNSSIPQGSLRIQVEGANAGGPFIAYGTNIIGSIAKGVLQ